MYVSGTKKGTVREAGRQAPLFYSCVLSEEKPDRSPWCSFHRFTTDEQNRACGIVSRNPYEVCKVLCQQQKKKSCVPHQTKPPATKNLFHGKH